MLIKQPNNSLVAISTKLHPKIIPLSMDKIIVDSVDSTTKTLY